MKRPKIKDYFHKKTDLETVHREYTKSPHLFSYVSALDIYIDYLEDELKTQLATNEDTKQSKFYCWNDDCGMEPCKKICISCEKYKGNGVKT